MALYTQTSFTKPYTNYNNGLGASTPDYPVMGGGWRLESVGSVTEDASYWYVPIYWSTVIYPGGQPNRIFMASPHWQNDLHLWIWASPEVNGFLMKSPRAIAQVHKYRPNTGQFESYVEIVNIVNLYVNMAFEKIYYNARPTKLYVGVSAEIYNYAGGGMEAYSWYNRNIEYEGVVDLGINSIKYWSGASWTNVKGIKAGTSWVNGTPKRWNGSAWVNIT